MKHNFYNYEYKIQKPSFSMFYVNIPFLYVSMYID